MRVSNNTKNTLKTINIYGDPNATKDKYVTKGTHITDILYHMNCEDINIALTQLLEEYEKKIKILSDCLLEKADENVKLFKEKQILDVKLTHFKKEAESAKDLELVVSELNTMLREKDEEYEMLKIETMQKDREKVELLKLNEEFKRRIEALSLCLHDIAIEHVDFFQRNAEKTSEFSSKRSIPDQYQEYLTSHYTSMEVTSFENPPKYNLENLLDEKKVLEKELENIKKELDVAKQNIKSKESTIIKLNARFIEVLNTKSSYEESNELYEQKLKLLENDFMDNLHQEGLRRQESEYFVSKLKKKIAELQFLLDEKDLDSDSSQYSEDE